MSVNTMTIEQAAAFLTALYGEATGKQSTIQIANTADYTTVGTILLQGGLDPIMGGMTQVLDKTLFASRLYNKKYADVVVDERRFGAVTRKVNYLDTPLDSADQRYTLTDGASVDMFVVKKPKVVQMNYYGAKVYSDSLTIFRDQLDLALRNAEEGARFWSGVMTEIANKHKQYEESDIRSIIINFITAKYTADAANAINVLQEYYNETGVTLTPANYKAVGNFSDFMRWFAGWLETLADRLSDRSLKYHMNITGKEVMRFTDAKNLRKYFSNDIANYLRSIVESNIFNPDRLSAITDDMRKVSYWQNIDDPFSVQATPAYLNTTTGAIDVAGAAVKVENIIGILFDRDALGLVKRHEWSAATPFNSKGGYYNIDYHWENTTWNSFDENFVLLYADTVTP